MYNCLMKASHLIWNTQFGEAKEYITPLIHIPRMAYELATMDIIASNLSGETSVRENSLKGIEVAENALKQVGHSTEEILKIVAEYKQLNSEIENEKYYSISEMSHSNFMELDQMGKEQILFNFELDHMVLDAETHMMRGIIQFYSGSYLKGFYNLRRSYLRFKEVYNIVEQFKDETTHSPKFIHSDVIHNAYFGIGIFNFMLSILPPTLTQILSLIGFDADRDHGLNLLRKVHEYGGRQCAFASFMLAMNYLFIPRALEDREKKLLEGGLILDRSNKVFTKSGLFKFMTSHYERKRGNISSAVENLKDAIDICQKSMGIAPNILRHELSWCYLLTLNFQDASVVLEEILNTDKEFDTKGISAMMLAVCRIKTGDKEGTNSIINNFSKYISKTGRLDKYALEKSEILKHLPTENERHLMMFISVFQFLYLKRDLANLSEQYAEPLYRLFVDICDQVKIDDKSKLAGDIEAGLLVVKGQFLKQMNKYEESIEQFKRALLFEHKIRYEKQWIAFPYYEVGELIYLYQVPQAANDHTKLELLQCVKQYFEKCNNYHRYSFEEVLHSRVKLALRQVESDLKNVKNKMNL
ncbi:hypothetical protein C9374_007804 [Naegleria lovaniensis]|uniref:Uncharacterized protein n=1 Tax=Naegleria lovaniensis TaxID=51637 RepID=A0AA88KIF4_NAELO|nr:uncharacterized protein C9374_007804 [Naegleria lovaniensis]KAG2379166.1 hypothetical protein C9374_007804 [Naegleria lovaniensis]